MHKLTGRRAFTLIEVLVTCSIIAILVGLLVVSVSAVLRGARTSRCVSNTRQAAQHVVQYSADWKDYFPLGTPGPDFYDQAIGRPIDLTVVWSPLGVVRVSQGWEDALTRAGITIPDDWRRCPAQQAGEPVDPTVVANEMSMAMFMATQSLSDPAPTWEPRFFATQQFCAVKYPSQKAMLFEDVPYHENFAGSQTFRTASRSLPWNITVAAVDASAQLRNNHTTVPGVDLHEGPIPGRQDLIRRMDTLRFTPDGVAGRDW